MSHSYHDDLVLIRRAREGDRAAMSDLIARYRDLAYRYAYRLTPNRDEAADIVAEAFVRVANSIHNFRGKSAFSTWLYRILTNCFLDSRKKEKPEALGLSLSNEGGESFDLPIADEGSDPFSNAVAQAREDAIQRVLPRLPPYQRVLLVLFHVEGRSYEEIAEALDLPIGTVKSRLNRARLALRDALGPHRELFSP